MSNIIKATFADGERRATTEALYQWDYGQVLEIEGLELPHNFEVHFGNSGSTTTVTQIATDGVVTIPDAVLTVGKSVDVFIYLHTGQSDGETGYRIVIPVRARQQPTHETPTPVQQTEIEQALAALNTAVDECESNAEHYPQIVDNYWYVWDADAVEYVNTGVKAKGEKGDPGELSFMGKCVLVTIPASSNLLNPNDVVMNAIIDITTGETTSNNSYWTTGYIPVESGKTYYLIRKDLTATQDAKYIVAFNASKEIMTSAGTSNVRTYTVPSGVAFIRFSKSYASSWTYYKPSDFMWTVESSPTAFEAYSPEEHYYYATDEFLSISTALTDKSFTGKYLDSSLVNLIDPDGCAIGWLVNKDTGELYQNESSSGYFSTGYIPIDLGQTVYFYRSDTNAGKSCARYAAYDANKTVIAEAGSNSEASSVTQSGNVAFIRCSFSYLSTDTARLPAYTACLANSTPDFVPAYGRNPVVKSDYIRKRIDVYATDTESQIIQKFIDAYNRGECDVVFERADYTFGTELEKISTSYGMIYNEIPVGNGCRYFFNGSTLTATVDLSQHIPDPGDDEFYCNFFGCQRVPSSFEMHDGVLHATDTRYVVHDESSAMSGTYKHLYENMEMHYHTDNRTEDIRKCIGGGTGKNGVVEIVGCKFTTDAPDVPVSFHGNGSDVPEAKFDLAVRNCWFSGGIRAGALSANQTARLFYCGNSATVDPSVYDGWTATLFLNEVRT